MHAAASSRVSSSTLSRMSGADAHVYACNSGTLLTIIKAVASAPRAVTAVRDACRAAISVRALMAPW